MDVGAYGSVTEIAEAEKISKSYVSRILRLALPAPDIVEATLGGWADQRVMLERPERRLPVGWEGQRTQVQADETRPTVTFAATAAEPEWEDASSGATITLAGRSGTAPTQPLVSNAS